MSKLRCVFLSGLVIALLLSSSPIFANGIRADLSASGKGVQNPDCAATIQANPNCFEFSVVSSTEANWEAFVLKDFDAQTFTTIGPYDLFQVNNIVAGTQVTLTLPGASDAFGSFFCGDDPFNNASIVSTGFCSDPTDALSGDASGIFSQVPPLNIVGNQATFIFNGTGPTSWVFYGSPDVTISTSTGSTTVSEPSSLLLLAAGLTLAGLKLRRS